MFLFFSLFLAFVVVMPCYWVSLYKASRKKNCDKMLATAIERGHVVRARLVKQSTLLSDVPGIAGYTYRLVYTYSYKGKDYKYLYWSATPPETLTLYFVKDPRKATVPGAMSPEKTNWVLVYLILTAVFYLFLRMAYSGV